MVTIGTKVEVAKILSRPVTDEEMPDHKDDWGVPCCYSYEVEEILQARMVEVLECLNKVE
jgi:hypothetical protein